MNIKRLWDRAINAYLAHKLAIRCDKNTRRLMKMSPEHARLSAQREEARKRHKATRDIERRQRALTNGLLKG